jgi:peptide/nickel transport system permease protein
VSRWRYFGQRLLLSIPVVVFAMTITFAALRMGPLDPAAAILGPQGDPKQYEQIRQQLGLNQPLWAQYVDFMVQMFTLELGESWVVVPDTNAKTLVANFAPRTIWLSIWSIAIALFVGIPLGFYAGLNPNTGRDYIASFGGIVWRAMPNFWLAVMILTVLIQSDQYVNLYWLGIDWAFEWSSWIVTSSTIGAPPLQFYEITARGPLGIPLQVSPKFENFLVSLKMVAPPAIVLGSASMGNEMRIGRTAILETINANYVETAKAKGVSNTKLIWKHVFRNAMIPLVPVITNEAFLLIGGSVIVETIFGINGLGFLFFRSLLAGDLPLAGSLMFVFVVFLVGINVFQDFLYTVIDPRVGYDT